MRRFRMLLAVLVSVMFIGCATSPNTHINSQIAEHASDPVRQIALDWSEFEEGGGKVVTFLAALNPGLAVVETRLVPVQMGDKRDVWACGLFKLLFERPIKNVVIMSGPPSFDFRGRLIVRVIAKTSLSDLLTNRAVLSSLDSCKVYTMAGQNIPDVRNLPRDISEEEAEKIVNEVVPYDIVRVDEDVAYRTKFMAKQGGTVKDLPAHLSREVAELDVNSAEWQKFKKYINVFLPAKYMIGNRSVQSFVGDEEQFKTLATTLPGTSFAQRWLNLLELPFSAAAAFSGFGAVILPATSITSSAVRAAVNTDWQGQSGRAKGLRSDFYPVGEYWHAVNQRRVDMVQRQLDEVVGVVMQQE